MENTVKDLVVTPDIWLAKRQAKMLEAIESLKQVKAFAVPNPEEDMHLIHANLSGAREYQTFVLNLLVGVNAMELEAKRLLDKEEISYKDAMSVAFTKYAEVVERAKSFEEKTLRLRPYVPQIKAIEEWKSILTMIDGVKTTLNLVYGDLSKTGFALNSQIALLKTQVLTGELKIQVDGFTARGILAESTMSSPERFSTDQANSPLSL